MDASMLPDTADGSALPAVGVDGGDRVVLQVSGVSSRNLQRGFCFAQAIEFFRSGGLKVAAHPTIRFPVAISSDT